MGNTCTTMADSCECMAEPPQYCKVINLQLKKVKNNKKKEISSCDTELERLEKENPEAMETVTKLFYILSMDQ